MYFHKWDETMKVTLDTAVECHVWIASDTIELIDTNGNSQRISPDHPNYDDIWHDLCGLAWREEDVDEEDSGWFEKYVRY